MGHFNVGDEYVGLVCEHGFQRFFAVARLRDHRDVAFNVEQRGQRAQHHSLIFGENHADGLAGFFCAVSGAVLDVFSEWTQFWQPSSLDATCFRGNVIVSVVPASVLRCSVPPSISTRSRMPRKPLPSPFEEPQPSS